MRPLFGRTVLLTRPKTRTAETSRLFRALGARVVEAPLIRSAAPASRAPLDRAIRALEGFDAVAFTSPAGVDWFFRRARALLGRRPARPSRLLAVGPGTARALAERGWPGARVPRTHTGAGLAGLLGRARGLKVLVPGPESGRDELPRLLRRAGAKVSLAPAYRTVADPRGVRRLRSAARRGADWVVFASPSAVERFFAALPRGRAAALLTRARTAVIGPTTAESLRRKGVRPSVESPEAGPAALARAVAAASRTAEPPLRALEETLVRALREAGAVLRRRFGRVTLRYKGRADIVTEADLAAEQRILDVVLGRFPGHDFVTEERPPRSGGSEYLWLIDPLDGTTNYAHGFPVCCVSIALLRRGRPLVSGVYDPFRDELFLARRGGGATLNGRRLRVSGVSKLGSSLLLTGFAYDRGKRADYYLRFFRSFLERCHDVRRDGSAALDLAWTAAGRVDGFWEFNLKPWDVAAGWLLVEEAGGKVTDFSGRSWTDPRELGRQTLASNGLIHGAMLRRIRKDL